MAKKNQKKAHNKNGPGFVGVILTVLIKMAFSRTGRVPIFPASHTSPCNLCKQSTLYNLFFSRAVSGLFFLLLPRTIPRL